MTLDRRTFLRGTAWSAPLVLSSQLPAFAAGSEQPTTSRSVDVTVSGQCNIWGSGYGDTPAPAGGGGGLAPVVVDLLSSDTSIQVTNTGGTIKGRGDFPVNGPEGDPSKSPNLAAYRGIAGIKGDSGFPLVGCFVPPGTLSEVASPPRRQDFGLVRDDATFSPEMQQPFFIGDGQGAAGTQTFNIPAGADRLCLGTIDGLGGSPGYFRDNSGFFTATVTIA